MRKAASVVLVALLASPPVPGRRRSLAGDDPGHRDAGWAARSPAWRSRSSTSSRERSSGPPRARMAPSRSVWPRASTRWPPRTRQGSSSARRRHTFRWLPDRWHLRASTCWPCRRRFSRVPTAPAVGAPGAATPTRGSGPRRADNVAYGAAARGAHDGRGHQLRRRDVLRGR